MTMGLAGCVLRAFPFGLNWSFCMMVGSILAATDPVAVVAILKEVGVVNARAPHRGRIARERRDSHRRV